MKSDRTRHASSQRFLCEPRLSVAQFDLAVAEARLAWTEPQQELVLAEDEVHLWRAWLDELQTPVEEFECILSSEELARANRFYFEHNRRHFVARRGLLRMILGRYLEVEPGELDLSCGSHGKPCLNLGANNGAPSFNLSHSGTLALFAVTRHREVGIDVERIRPIPELAQLADHCLTGRERSELLALRPENQVQTLLVLWTGKEACLKARGEGISERLKRVEVTLSPGEGTRLLNVSDNDRPSDMWTLLTFEPAAGYRAALAVKETPRVHSVRNSTPLLQSTEG